VVNDGLRTISGDLGTSIADSLWVTNGYLLALDVSAPACGWLGRRGGVGRLWRNVGRLAEGDVAQAERQDDHADRQVDQEQPRPRPAGAD